MVLEGAILQNSFTSVYHKPVFGLYAPAFQYQADKKSNPSKRPRSPARR